MPSPREQLQDEIVEYLNGREVFTAPYGILTGKHTNAKGRSIRQVTFGKARTLDATVDIYGESYLLLRWQGALRNMGSGNPSVVFHSKQELFDFLDEAC
jgi:hypothetical protein